MDEQALIHEAQRGSLDAFNTLILHYQDSVYNTALRILGDEDLAADSTQEAFISAFKSISSFRGGSFKAWLMRTVTNACYDELRRRQLFVSRAHGAAGDAKLRREILPGRETRTRRKHAALDRRADALSDLVSQRRLRRTVDVQLKRLGHAVRSTRLLCILGAFF